MEVGLTPAIDEHKTVAATSTPPNRLAGHIFFYFDKISPPLSVSARISLPLFLPVSF